MSAKSDALDDQEFFLSDRELLLQILRNQKLIMLPREEATSDFGTSASNVASMGIVMCGVLSVLMSRSG